MTIWQLLLVDLPESESMTLDRFVTVQEKRVTAMAGHLISKNLEVEEAVSDLGLLVASYELRHTTEQVDPEAVKLLSVHYAKAMYRSVLVCTQKIRLC